ncbi:MAG TPA: phosphoribosylformylglycinamidine cyclo-ligase, partial [Actinomycetota bacterium]|nr:phosphoribosylformylglycinamidine cyclo-ligase [Actinomycetota bacterium]
TAEHPGHMTPNSYDLAGFCVGVVERSRIVTGSSIQVGDVVLGIESSGLHSNGYSLVRKILLSDMKLDLEDRPIELGHTLGEELLRPTVIYSSVVGALMEEVDVHGLSHITGGGLPENVGRIMPEGLSAHIAKRSWEPHPIFGLISSLGQVEEREMFSTFNMGIGMVVVVQPEASNHALDVIRSRGHRAHEIGEVLTRSKDHGPIRLG